MMAATTDRNAPNAEMAERIERLPKAVREHIERLERERDQALAAAREATAHPGRAPQTGDVVGEAYATHPQHLRNGTTVRFYLATDLWINARVDTNRSGGPALALYASGDRRGADDIVVLPCSGNHVDVRNGAR